MFMGGRTNERAIEFLQLGVVQLRRVVDPITGHCLHGVFCKIKDIFQENNLFNYGKCPQS